MNRFFAGTRGAFPAIPMNRKEKQAQDAGENRPDNACKGDETAF